MKLLSDITKKIIQNTKIEIVEFIAVLGGWKKLEAPKPSNEINCTICSGKNHYTPFVNPEKDRRRIWICADGDCVTNTSVFHKRNSNVAALSKRALEWPLFCELNSIGDIHNDVKFENVMQSKEKKSFILEFSQKPSGLILMRGEPGTGKTYCCMAICEIFTKKSSSCYFFTQKQMFIKWLNDLKSDGYNSFYEKLSNISLLVIDDFGTGDISPAFMTFFMELINFRMQWREKGTVINTNLDHEKLSNFCGDALLDRLNTAKLMVFEGESRRE